jgi:tetratricopeptide (TPR) repeat protein
LEAQSLTDLAEVLMTTKNYTRAEECLVIAAKIHAELGDKQLAGNQLTNLAVVRLLGGRAQHALEPAREARALCQQTGDRAREAHVLGVLGNTHVALKDFLEAIRCFEEAAAGFRDAGDRRQEALALSSLATAYFKAGQLDRALECHGRALPTYRETDRQAAAIELINMSFIQHKLGDHASALASAQEAVGLADVGSPVGEEATRVLARLQEGPLLTA